MSLPEPLPRPPMPAIPAVPGLRALQSVPTGSEVVERDEPDVRRFEDLDDEARRRVIVRLLCGLVALDDQERPVERPIDLVRPGRRLPLLGLEFGGEDKLRHEPRRPLQRLLPYLGDRRGTSEKTA